MPGLLCGVVCGVDSLVRSFLGGVARLFGHVGGSVCSFFTGRLGCVGRFLGDFLGAMGRVLGGLVDVGFHALGESKRAERKSDQEQRREQFQSHVDTLETGLSWKNGLSTSPGPKATPRRRRCDSAERRTKISGMLVRRSPERNEKAIYRVGRCLRTLVSGTGADL